jgi:GNAT superfamily N-acetyltransferase
LVGELESGLVASAQASWLRYLMYDGGLVCHLESVRVAPSHRGRGLGQRLVSTIIELARDRGCARLQLSTNAARADARRFYRRLGFVESHIGMKLFLEEA